MRPFNPSGICFYLKKRNGVGGTRLRSGEQPQLTYQRFLEAIRAIPGAVSAGTVDAAPFSGESLGGIVATAGAQAVQTFRQIDRRSELRT